MRTSTLSFASFALMATLALTPATPAAAQEGCAGEPDAYRLRQAIPLAEAMPEQRGAGPWPRIFQQNSIELVYAPGQKVLLAGSANGLRTDDLVQIDAAPSGQHWEHDFRDAAHTRIVPLTEPPDLTAMFVAGSNQITITLKDLLGPVHSTSAYTMQVWEPCEESPVTPVPTATPDAAALGVGVDKGTPGAASVSVETLGQTPVGASAPSDQSAAAVTQLGNSQTPIRATLEAILKESEAGTLGKVAGAADPEGSQSANQAAAQAPADSSMITQAVTQTIDAGTTPASQDPVATVPVAPKRKPVWPFFIFAGLLFSVVWYRKRHPDQWQERLTQLRHLADETMSLARALALALWQEYAAERYEQLVKVLVENKNTKQR